MDDRQHRAPKTFHIGTRIVAGSGATSRLGSLLAPYRRRWAVVADRGIAEVGLLDQILSNAAGEALSTPIFVEVNPNLASVAHAAEQAAGMGCDGVLAVGGGSALCAAKAVAILLTNDGPIDQYEGVGLVPCAPLPTVAVPTTAGSGSEVSNALVLHEPGRPCEVVVRAPGCEPEVAVLDGTVLRTLPAQPMIEAALDALTHALEALWVHGRTFFTDALATKAAGNLCDTLPLALERRDDERLQTLIEASAAANLACGNSGLGLVHALTTSPQVRLAHGYQNGALLLHVAAFNEPFLDEPTRALVASAAALYDRLDYQKGFAPTDTTSVHRGAFLAASSGHAFRANNIRASTDAELHAVLDAAGVAGTGS